MRLTRFVVVCALAAVAYPVRAQSVDAALTAAIAARDKAAIARDVDGVAKYTADDYFAVNPSGVLNSKPQRLAGLKAPANPTAKPQPPQRTEFVRMYGSGAAVGRMRVGDQRHLAVWIKNASGWQVTAIHIAPDAVGPPPLAQERPKTAQPLAITAPAGLSGDRAAVFAIFKQLQDAFYAGDRAAYDKLTSPEHARISSGGMVRFGTENSIAIDGPRNPVKFSNISVQAWDQLGVVRWTETNAAGQSQWLTRVLAKKAGGWQQVATASSPAGNPPVAP